MWLYMVMQITPRSWRIDQKLTLERAALLVGVRGKNPARTWQRWETGELEPPLDIVSAVSRVSGGTVNLESWRAVRQARLNAPSTPSPDSTAVHGDAASANPIPETVSPPPPDHVTGDREVAPAGDAG